MFALVDCNSFYASCEKVFRPDLWGKPVVVLSNNDGCIIARSAEAKALGIEMGVPIFKCSKFLKKHGVHIFSSNYTLYGDLSSRVMAVLSGFAPQIETYSIDESFLDLSGIPGLQKYGHTIKNRVWKHTGIPVSVGIGPTKTLAKLASHLAKKPGQYSLSFSGNVCVMAQPTDWQSTFQKIPIEKVWGIGRRRAALLNRQSIHSVADFMRAPENWVRKQMTVTGQRTYLELHGHPCMELETEPPAKKGICTARSFGKPLEQFTEVAEALVHYVTRAAVKLRAQKSCAGILNVFILTNHFKPNEKQYSNSVTLQLPQATNSTLLLAHYAQKALKAIFRPGYRYKKVGVMLEGFCPENTVQLGIDFRQPEDRQTRLMETLDFIEQKMGKGKLYVASEDADKGFWMRQEHKSPCYTTRIEELPIINI